MIKNFLTIKNSERLLRQKCSETDFEDRYFNEFITDLKQTAQSLPNCFALAANQIGIPYKIVYIKSDSVDLSNSGSGDFFMINPVVISKKGKTQFYEACVSGESNMALVERPYEITVKFFDENKNEKVKTFKGFVTTIICHELDHLDGVFHMDRAVKLFQVEPQNRQTWRKENNVQYNVLSEDCKFEYDKVTKEIVSN